MQLGLNISAMILGNGRDWLELTIQAGLGLVALVVSIAAVLNGLSARRASEQFQEWQRARKEPIPAILGGTYLKESTGKGKLVLFVFNGGDTALPWSGGEATIRFTSGQQLEASAVPPENQEILPPGNMLPLTFVFDGIPESLPVQGTFKVVYFATNGTLEEASRANENLEHSGGKAYLPPARAPAN